VDGELVPFDVIQANGTRVPYSQDNLVNILHGIEKLYEEEKNGKASSGYKGLATAVSPSTSPGFLGTTMSIQNKYTRHRGGAIFAMASEKGEEGFDKVAYAKDMATFDAACEKVAALKPLTKDNEVAIMSAFEKIAHEELMGGLEKLADDTNSSIDAAVEKLAALHDPVYVNANTLPGGTTISFPEKKGNEFTITKAVIVDSYMDFSFLKAPKTKMIVAQDGRMIMLKPGDTFLCVEDDSAIFSLPTRPLSTLKDGDFVSSFVGDKALFPSRVNWINADVLKSESDVFAIGRNKSSFHNGPIVEASTNVNSEKNRIVTYNVSPLMGEVDDASMFNMEPSILDNKRAKARLVLVESAGGKFDEITYSDFIKRKAEETGMNELIIRNSASAYSVCSQPERNYEEREKSDKVVIVDSDMKMIVFTGIIDNYLKNEKEIDKLATYSGVSEDEIEKSAAGERESVIVRLIDRQKNLYFIQIYFKDQSKKMMSMIKREFRNVQENHLKEVLRLLGFDVNKIADIIYKAKNENYVNYPLPVNNQASMLTGGTSTNVAAENFKKTLTKVVNPQDVKEVLLGQVLGAMIAQAAISGGAKAIRGLGEVKKFASEAEALSIEFEKKAMELKDGELLKVAKAMYAAHEMNDKIHEIGAAGTKYPAFYDFAKGIVESQPYLEKMAMDLIAEKTMMYLNKNVDFSMNPNTLGRAVKHIDILVKEAHAVVNTIDKKAEMNVPTEEEKKKENNEATNEKNYLKPIECEVCGYKGKPADDGTCPQCGAIGGKKKENDDLESKDFRSGDYDNSITEEEGDREFEIQKQQMYMDHQEGYI
jgi:predicted Zn-ribbon and HTH transcriptional regulator